MNENDKVHEYFQRLAKQKPFISMQELRDLVDERYPNSEQQLRIPPRRYQYSYLWASAAVCALAVCIFIVVRSVHVQKHIVATDEHSNPSVQNKVQSRTKEPERQASSYKSENSRGNNGAAYNDSAKNSPKRYGTRLVNWIPRRLAPTKIYELDSAELSKLAIIAGIEGEIAISSQNGKIFLKSSIDGANKFSYSIRIQKAKQIVENDPLLFPKIVTDERGKKVICLSNEIFEIISMEQAVPIRLVAHQDSEKRSNDHSGYFILWYEYSELLLSLLPERIVRELRTGSKGVFDPDLMKNQRLYVDIRMPSESKDAIVEYRTQVQDMVSISLFDVTGTKVGPGIPVRNCRTKRCSERVPLEDLEPGIYLLAVCTDAGTSSLNWIYTE